MDSSWKSQPDPKFSPLTIPVAYHHSLPRIAYYPPFSSFFSHCESDGRMIAAPVSISQGDEICSSSFRYSTCTPDELPSEGADDSPVFLTDKELWRTFYQASTEMIVNKSGRYIRLLHSVNIITRFYNIKIYICYNTINTHSQNQLIDFFHF